MNLLEKLNSDEMFCIDEIKRVSIIKKVNTYIVGGAVRDLLLNRHVEDIDICIEENPMIIINELSNIISSYVYYDKFETSTLYFLNGVTIDLIRCREETYESNGSLPKVIPSNIKNDLKRRDFTINSICYDIINMKLLDPYNGCKDLKNGIIKSTHENSYEEDPTRIFRAIRYASRYDFFIKDKSEIKKHMFNNISNDRFIKEIVLICEEKEWIKSIVLLKNLNIEEINIDMLGKMNLLDNYDNLNTRIVNVFLCCKCADTRQRFINNSILSKELKASFKYYIENSEQAKNVLKGNISNYAIYNVLKNSPYYFLVLLAWDKNINYKILNYYNNLCNMDLISNATYLINNGIKEGKIIGDILEYIREIKYNTGIDNDYNYLIKNLGEIINDLKHKN